MRWRGRAEEWTPLEWISSASVLGAVSPRQISSDPAAQGEMM